MTPSSFCPKCGTAFSEADRFRPKCGTARPVVPQPSQVQPSAATEPAPAAPAIAATPVPAPGYPYAAPQPVGTTVAGDTALIGPGPAFRTPDSDAGKRFGGWAVTNIAPAVIGWIPVIGWIISAGLSIFNLMLFARGQDLGALTLKMRVLRHNGEAAGFFHMWTRGLATILSVIPLFAGYWTAFSDPRKRTWHDKLLNTYVINDHPDYARLPKTNSSAAVAWFWVSIGAFIVIAVIAVAVLVAVARTVGF